MPATTLCIRPEYGNRDLPLSRYRASAGNVDSMRVLVVDQDSASNLAITRSLRDLYTVDCVTNKGDCLDLLRSNAFEVIVATERLEDGSGLELLGQISKKWPSVLRIFAADRQRLQLLRGRLGPFELFQTLTYPIDPERLVATLALADAAQHADADTSDIQQIELSGETPAEEPQVTEPMEFGESFESEASGDFPAPRPTARAASMEQAQAASGGRRGSSRGVSAPQSRPTPAQRPRSNGTAGVPTARPAAGASSGRSASTNGSGSPGSAPSARRSNSDRSGARGAASLSRGVDAAPSFAGSGTIGPRRESASSAGASPPGRSRGATNKAPPVRFPPLERTPPLERIPPLEPPQESSGRRSGGDAFAEAAAMARAARSNYESTTEEFDTKRLAVMIGGGLAVALAVVFLGVKIFGSKSDTPRPAPPAVAHAPEYPQEVTDLIAQTEAAFKADDFKTAQSDVDKLRQLSPSHPRLGFFEGLLTARADNTAKGGASGRGGSKKNGKSATTSPGSPSKADTGSALASSSAGSSGTASSGAKSGSGAASGTALSARSGAAGTTSSTSSPAADASSQGEPALPPETPVGFSRASAASTDTQHAADAAHSSVDVASGTHATGAATSAMTSEPSAPGSAAPGGASTVASAASNASGPGTAAAGMAAGGTAAASAPPAVAEVPHTSAPSSSSTRRASGEPPPVIQEAKLIRRVNPDYPSAAKKDGIAGWVDLELTVSTHGVVEDVSVLQATPPETFEKSALAAVRKWKYDPRFVDGLPSQAHLKVHLEFGPNK
ncbi:MAG TPA: TonB family protein [Steroidobacteraceae bacterium]|nr:TonB family protein [Steroidobacteraceae bacterium]